MAKITERDDNHAKCVVCGEYKEHVESGIMTPSGRLIFIADKGTPWKLEGKKKTCPDCVGEQPVLKELCRWDGKPRVCVECEHRVLPTRRARVCEFCKPDLNHMEVDEDFMYSEMGD